MGGSLKKKKKKNQRNSSDWRKSGITLVKGDGKVKQGQVHFTRWVAVCDSAKAVNSADHKIYF